MDPIDAEQRDAPAVVLPPGQRRTDGFPRFGTHLHHPAPVVPADHRLRVVGAVAEELAVSLPELAALPRQRIIADFHCVAGWSATDLHWEGAAFGTFFRSVVVPALDDGVIVSHLVFGGLDGYASVVGIEDALRDDVLLADMLDDQPLDADHGAPLRLVSPSQYGFVSTKHLGRIGVHTTRPPEPHRSFTDRLLLPHPRARVWHEERHGRLPAWAVRGAYRMLIPPIRFLSARGSRHPVAAGDAPSADRHGSPIGTGS